MRRGGARKLRAQGTGLRAQGSGLRAQGSEHRAQGSGLVIGNRYDKRYVDKYK